MSDLTKLAVTPVGHVTALVTGMLLAWGLRSSGDRHCYRPGLTSCAAPLQTEERTNERALATLSWWLRGWMIAGSIDHRGPAVGSGGLHQNVEGAVTPYPLDTKPHVSRHLAQNCVIALFLTPIAKPRRWKKREREAASPLEVLSKGLRQPTGHMLPVARSPGWDRSCVPPHIALMRALGAT
ncbi:hypothetical protein [Streptomyces sp. NPDC048361]|uniref:hypothetical protein n=1 Tax=Streptomyces sp. NPDC048361 TaxID=3154720 RepID=UPI00342FD33F